MRSTNKQGTVLRKQQVVKNNKNVKRVVISFLLATVGIVIYLLAYQYTYQAKLETKFNQVQSELNSKEDSLKRTDEQNKKLEQEKLELQKQLQAKKTEQLRIASIASQTVKAESVKVAVTDSQCQDWMAQAGIPITYASKRLILNESGCKYWAINPKSGACGIPQAYPCSKLPCTLDEAGVLCQLKWMQNYVVDRYTTWENALAKWHSRCGSKEGCWY